MHGGAGGGVGGPLPGEPKDPWEVSQASFLFLIQNIDAVWVQKMQTNGQQSIV